MTYDEFDPMEYDDRAHEISGYRGIAWHLLGWETIPDEETEWSGYLVRTGNVVAVMVGDDRHFSFEPDDITPLDDNAYCPSCGQIGCAWH